MTPTATRTTTPVTQPMSVQDDHDDKSCSSRDSDKNPTSTSSNHDPNNSRTQANVQHVEADIQVAVQEGAWVWRLRILTTLVLLSVAIVVCAVVYAEGRSSETRAFEQAFDNLGAKMVRSFEAVVEQRFGMIAAFGESITSDAGTGQGLPFVTPPHFAHRAESVAVLAQLFFLLFLPRVARDQVPEWEEYSVQNQGWKKDGVAQQLGVHPSRMWDPIPAIPPTILNAHNPNGPTPAVNVTPDADYFYPIWCNYPTRKESPANIDMNGDAEHQVPIQTTVTTGIPTFEISYDYMDGNYNDRYNLLKNNPHVDYQDDPHAVAFFPVMDQFVYEPQQLGQDATPNGNVGGLLLIIIYWRTYFDDLLPPGSDGISVILENTCDQQFTYRIDGVHSSFVGHGDLHDPKYDYLEAGTSIDSILGGTNIVNSNNGCHYSIRVYPSQEFEDDHRTSKPWVYVAVLAALFLFTSAVFLLYDYMVEQRQRIVLQSAQQSGKLVNTLFPEDVRDQLYQEQKEQAQVKHQKESWETTGGNNDAVRMIGRANSNPSLTDSTTSGTLSKKAIASLHPETSIVFADLVGFTAWSGKRTPVEVFQLLESLFSAFDFIATKRGVFKVETIGDCYVAATGLPQAQPDHGVILCKFAMDCINKMKIMTVSLADSLGEDTQNLSLRVGIHSGPVTAGVLRGKKSRFQLFGDTVNVAARMESNGMPNSIHVSEETANVLRAKGRASWLTPRKDKITAKGKGVLQTYWVDTSSKSRSDGSAFTAGDITISSGEMSQRNSAHTGSGLPEQSPVAEDLAGLTVSAATQDDGHS